MDCDKRIHLIFENNCMYPYERSWSIDSINIERYSSVNTNWKHSKETINNIRVCLSSASKLPHEVSAIVAAGSLARMEASPNVSDADLIIVLNDGVDLESQAAKDIYEAVWAELDSLNLEKPKPTGVFSVPTSCEQLLSSVGNIDEPYRVFGKRLLLLLESQPLLKDENYTKLIDEIVDRYADKYVQENPGKEWTLLLNDLIRYFRSLAVNYQWDFDNEAEKWAIRNIKLRHSRLVMYSGLLFLLGEASKERQDKVSWLKRYLKMTPLERLAWVYEQNSDWNFYRVIGSYNLFLSRISIPEVRKSLNYNPSDLDENYTKDNHSYPNRYDSEEFSNLKANSDGLIAELLRFVFSRRGDWTERFFEYLVF